MTARSYDPGPAFFHEVRPRRPIYLSGVNHPLVDQMMLEGYDVGLLATPATYHAKQTLRYPAWALDNGCFASSQAGIPFDFATWTRWLASWPPPSGVRFGNRGTVRESRLMTPDTGPMPVLGCLFAVAPDIVGDARATWSQSAPWFELIRRLGFPAALAGQNGLEDDPRPWDEPDRWDCLFVGGDDEWKDGPWARECARHARLLGKWVHVGRVNTRSRMMAWADLADSMDGTMFRWPQASAKKLRRWLDELAQPSLELSR